MSSFKEILFVVQKTHTDPLGYERVAMELANEVNNKYKSRLIAVPVPQSSSYLFVPKAFLQFVHRLKYFFICLRLGMQGDFVYFFDKNVAWSLPLIRLLGKKRILVQMDRPRQRWKQQKQIHRIIERLKERLILRFSDRVFVDHKSAQAYFKLEYQGNTYINAYGADHMPVWSSTEKLPAKLLGKEYAVSFMAESTHQTYIALRAFAQYPKYDYFLLVDGHVEQLPEEIRRFEAYDNIHFISDKNDFLPVLAQTFLYIHLESTVTSKLRLIEAMKAGKKVICFDTPFSRNLTASDALYFQHYTQLLSCLQRAVRQSHFDQGARMRKLALALTWTHVADRLYTAIDELMLEDSRVGVHEHERVGPQLVEHS